MYLDQPAEELTLHDFEVLALDRLKVLKGIEAAKARGLHGEDVSKRIRQLVKKHLEDPMMSRDRHRNDSVSHHILRLAFCQNEEKRRWFLTMETALFRHRLESHTAQQVSDFMRDNGLHYEQIGPEEKEEVFDKLVDVVRAQTHSSEHGSVPDRIRRSAIFRVHFTQALELIGRRRVLLQGGFAYVPRDNLVTILVDRFRATLSRSLAFAARALPSVLADERLGPLLGNMSKAYTGQEYGAGGSSASAALGTVRPSDVDDLAKSSFPLCMRHLHETLKEKHHLKHGGRMQYGLFLKGIGLSLEDALTFWQAEFTKSMSAEDFVKKYAYNIRHNYGKEGKRADYTPYSCQRIIMGTAPGGGDAHGCPYRHWDEAHLRGKLAAMNLNGSAISDIMASVKSKDYQIACRREFEARHGRLAEEVGNHPNAYFEESVRHSREEAEAAAEQKP